MSTVRLSQSMRLDRMVRYCLLASLVLALFAGLPAGQAFARPLLVMTYTQSVELTSNTSQTNAAIGSPIAISGDTVVLGAPNYNSGMGAVYVVDRSPLTGVWDTANMVTLTNPSGVSGDHFGYAVAIEDDTIVVGARNQDVTVNSTLVRNAGAVYIFTRSGGVWSLAQGGTAFYNKQSRDDQFGSSVAISGNTIAVGVPYEDPMKNVKNAGTVLLFKRGENSLWSYSTEITGPVDTRKVRGDLYGSTLAVEGDTLLVGAPMANGTCGGACGTVTVYARNPMIPDQWNQVTVLQATPRVNNEYFGKSVAISGSRIVVGAPSATNSGLPGRAYIFNLPGSTASQVTYLTGTTAPGTTGQFGASVAIDGNRIAVGQPYPTTSAGAVIVYEDALLNGQWAAIQTLGLTSPVSGDQLGAAVVMSGQTVFAGAPGRTPTGGANDQGAAYIFTYVNTDGGGPTTYAPELDLDSTLNGTGFNATFTVPVAPAALQPAAVVNTAALTINDVDSTELTGATVKLINLQDTGKEILSATDSGNVHASYDASGVLTLSPVTGDKAPLSDFQAVLRTVVYSNTSWVPNTTPRLVEFQTSDGTNTSNMAVATIFVVRSMQNPVVTFVMNGNAPYHINHPYTIDVQVARPVSVGAELGIPSGSVTIQVAGGPSCQVVLNASGQGACSLTMTSVGGFDISAVYSGDSVFNAKTVSLGFLFDYNKIYMPFLRK